MALSEYDLGVRGGHSIPLKTLRPTVLDPKELIFVYEYGSTGNMEAAAISAGYPPLKAKHHAKRLLKKTSIAVEVNRLRLLMRRRYEVALERTIAEVASIAFQNINDYLMLDKDGMPTLMFTDLTPDQWAAISEIRYGVQMKEVKGVNGKTTVRPVRYVREIKMHSKLHALEMMMKHLGAYAGNLKPKNEEFDFTIDVDTGTAVSRKTSKTGELIEMAPAKAGPRSDLLPATAKR